MVPPPKKVNIEDEPDPAPYLFITLEQKLKDQAKPYDAQKMTWINDEKEMYVIGTITGESGDNVTVEYKGEKKTIKKDELQQVNPPKYEKCEDISNLTYLNDASVLYNLKERYYADLIYTYSGLFCIVINPYKRFPIYGARAVNIYRGKRKNEVPPHLFAVSDGAYQQMLVNRQNQSMLITGESGAGKTENTKKVISYLSQVGSTGKKDENAEKKANLEDQIVQTNPVLESFGNAKTVRNDNSSRFGKFIRIHFGPTGKLASADIESYLLEKARVISQQSLERSYHIFYQIISGKIPGMREMLFLTSDIYDYNYVSQGKTTIPNVDDAEEMGYTDTAFDILNFSLEEKTDVYKITAAVMHFGTLKFKQRPREEQAEPDGMDEGERIGNLLGVDHTQMYNNICKPRVKVGTEMVTKAQSAVQCSYGCGAIAKGMFDRMFKWIVGKCNETLDTPNKRQYFIGVLDIAGFEIFEDNGFEQLCINFTNEKLQQFFNHHMFVLEQEEYTREQITWAFIDFGMDLAACIELIEKPMGILAILEEESNFPKASDKTFDEKLKANHLGKSKCFLKPKPPKAGGAEAHFALVHYAGTVAYNICGWLEKNKDPLNDCLVDQLKNGSNKLVVKIFEDHPGLGGGKDDGGGGKKKKGGGKTVSGAYKEQLNMLMTTLKSTQPHFVRCIIPNEMKQPRVIDSHLVMHQLTCNGVLEGIRICRKGFPNRMVYPDFKVRYSILAPTSYPKGCTDGKLIADSVCKAIKLDEDKFRVGLTKIFFRAGTLGILEELRDERIGKILTYVQATIRWFCAKLTFKALQKRRLALQVLQRNIMIDLKTKTWEWGKIHKAYRGQLAARAAKKAEEERLAREAEERAQAAARKAAEEAEKRRQFEEEMRDIEKTCTDYRNKVAAQVSRAETAEDELAKMNQAKADVQQQLNDLLERLNAEEGAKGQLSMEKARLQKELAAIRDSLAENKIKLGDAEREVRDKEAVIANLKADSFNGQELIAKLTKERNALRDLCNKQEDEITYTDEKSKKMQQAKSKFEQQIAELEEELDNEKRAKGEIEKARRKAESDIKSAKSLLAQLQKDNAENKQTLKRKTIEATTAATSLEEEQAQIAKLQRQTKEFTIRLEELEEELENEKKNAHKRAEKQRMTMTTEINNLNSRLVEAERIASAAGEHNVIAQQEVDKLKAELDEAENRIQVAVAKARKTHSEEVADLNTELENAQKSKYKLEKDLKAVRHEIDEILHAQTNRGTDEKTVRKFERLFKDLQGHVQADHQTRVRLEAMVESLDHEIRVNTAEGKGITATHMSKLRQIQQELKDATTRAAQAESCMAMLRASFRV